MPQLLLEFFSEEIPARMQKRAEEDLARLMGEALNGAGFPSTVDGRATFSIRALSGPRRLCLIVEGLSERTKDYSDIRRGPRVGAPPQAINGFLKAAGLASIDDAKTQNDGKGDYYYAMIETPGRATADIIQEIVPKVAREFPWPKSMRSGSSDFIWVRPLHKVLCVFDGKAVPFEVGGVASGDQTEGHRFHAPAWIKVSNAAEYEAKLKAAFVLVDREARKAKILADAKAACAARQLELVEDAGLLEEVAGLAEWPVVVLGDMDPAFLDLPAEVIRLTMRTHQRYFAVKGKDGKLAPHFITIANVEAKDGGKAIAAGNARVLSARLNDARFFWEQDKKTPLESRTEKLKQIVFHQKLGSVWDKVERVTALAVELADIVGADKELVRRAAQLCKADLVTETVGEFPELQGQIGKQLYLLQNAPHRPLDGGGGRAAAGGGDRAASRDKPQEATPPSSPQSPPPALRASSPIEGAVGVEAVANAIEDHYRPVGPNDRVPSDPVALAVALADKLDTLVGFWAIDEKPTGSRDPYALRRAGLGTDRCTLDNNVRLQLRRTLNIHFERLWVECFCSTSRLISYTGADANYSVAFEHRSLNDVRDIDVVKEAILVFRELVRTLDAGQQLFGVRQLGGVVTLSLRHQLNDGRERTYLLETSEAIFELKRPTDLVEFLADRLKVQLRDQGKRHDLVDAVFALGDDDLVRIVARVEALEAFLKTDDGANLLAGYRRAANILKAEEKKDAALAKALAEPGALDTGKLTLPAERALLGALNEAGAAAKKAVEAEQFEAAMSALAKLRAPLDKFFEDVLVNDPDPALRKARLLLLASVRDALHRIADFSRIEG